MKQIICQDITLNITGKLTPGYYNAQEAEPCVFINGQVLDDLILEALYAKGFEGNLTFGHKEGQDYADDVVNVLKDKEIIVNITIKDVPAEQGEPDALPGNT